ncbi:MAG TPA: 2-succinyl-5-enolpyruvyl-6-hydroxy-3-cyclohexene-1-carboxylic-acid synthase [Flavobacteriaceae bacterium]|nr:2-succinyl-5-enolpyruvyl-6-hydroxy-3-cyclohexene-1-carboxylic-acid synthase [Flavobacteriaceae bacterium]MCB9212574.1 2-succinyl-5-enolpyruvyl-6-hydroxy-3-cyclohexene-1-carboxylic-acid synthase [Alteromonas sp.]HPF10642.1 2-succinyl-5-enolpyruvyl-6-hydroxy-3-cyclohexene-1-carboxylic-acid synthase [Flavobacteriaceae bacterium]HQU20924.1 2-succinyl-5-enolpyruvyl-6-hydroxy-3-cyclohexene-1-carboxylic-acid synthase [Flavobacteriaceae bacterium]HQU64408.1 2-succinyl-5-enolpyruvyl-6-hydroxy-3-cyclo
MNHSSKILSQTLVQLCLAKGIDHIVLSPGSRNAPLTIGFSGNSTFKNFSIVDERCAAFFGLGMAQQLGKPVVLVCTSGSALLNYYPAIAEAFYSHIPLIVVSADRPSELIDVGDGQTIRQEHVFENHNCYSASCKEGAEFQYFNEQEINKALNIAMEESGPVHINIPFSEPLYSMEGKPSVFPVNVIPKKLNSLSKIPQVFIDQWNLASRKLVLVGTLAPNTIAMEWLQILATDPSVVVMTETTSNLHHPYFFPAIDQLITSLDFEGFQQLRPEILLTVGGMIVSKRIKAFLRKFTPNAHWHVGPYKALDTYFCLTHDFRSHPNAFFEYFLKQVQPKASNYQPFWLAKQEERRGKQTQFELKMPYSDFLVYAQIFRSIPMGSQVQLANSTAIRYSQLFPSEPTHSIFCNRGTSGIDGSTSTAIGAAVTSGIPTVLVTGDLSFFYDSNALWNSYLPKSFRIILVNNRGGGIFRILPSAKEVPHFETYFETRHALTALHLCAMFDIVYQKVENQNELEAALLTFFKPSQRPVLLEIMTPSEINDQVLNDYFEAIA